MKKFLVFLGIVALLLGAYLVGFKEPGHVPLLDANRQRLAETEAEGWAAGWTFWKTSGTGSDIMAEEKRAETALPTEYDPRKVLHSFCV